MADDLIKTASFYFNSSLREQTEGGQCCRNECGKCPPVTLGEDMGGNVMELADGSTAPQLCIFSAWAKECGSGVSQCRDQDTQKEKKLLKPNRKLTFLEPQILTSERRRARESV